MSLIVNLAKTMKYRAFYFLLPLFLVLSCSASKQGAVPPKSNTLAEILKEYHAPNGKQVLVVAHRGDWRNAPENSLQAIKNAMAMGVDVVEIDIQRTKDGHLVLMHDKTIDRTTTGQGRVEDHTLAELRQLYLKGGHGVATGHRIPTLEEAMRLMKGKVMVNLDKGYDFFEEAQAILEATGTTGQTIIKSSHTFAKVRAEKGRIMYQVPFMPVVNLGNKNARQIIREYQRELKPAAFEIVFRADTSSILNELSALKQAGARVWVNALWPSLNASHHDDLAVEEGKVEESWGWLLDQGFNIIQTDRPVELIAYLRKRGLHH
ncbi:glycerophosphodiester phosphodiesterase family protein [Rufibacter psychrotolerans]|uniref:glycerophosphodiester phosphodiesterase family protein n=1 Tax=Rufibacter psychrotolerans TaxID=2812556 RepID=UPI001967BEE8|nr:glycerophosphodiester phosphodiesterase family protein [Rufibacter sp. SYSU D00308]